MDRRTAKNSVETRNGQWQNGARARVRSSSVTRSGRASDSGHRTRTPMVPRPDLRPEARHSAHDKLRPNRTSQHQRDSTQRQPELPDESKQAHCSFMFRESNKGPRCFLGVLQF